MDKERIIQALSRLGLHYQRPTRTPEEQALWLSDYAADLSFYPVETVEAACNRWRRDGKPKFPTIAELIFKCAELTPRLPGGEDTSKWRPISDAEYEALSLQGKIRHQEILAQRVWDSAGQIYRAVGSRDVAKLRLNADYVALEQREANHLAEAKRLTGFLRDEHIV